MPMRFEFATAGRILFGAGTLREIGPLARSAGTRPLVITGRNPERAEKLFNLLRAEKLEPLAFAISGEPAIERLVEGAAVARREKCDLIIGFGGGSAVDAAKAIAALARNDGDVFDYLEVIGRGQPLTHAALPCIAIPTTAGTGAEVTRNAVLFSPAHRVKASLRSPTMLPKLAIVDPELTLGLPPALTASTGLDALTQLIEPYVSARANPMTDALCVQAIPRAARGLRRACEKGDDLEARTEMALASLFSGMALANAGLGAVHGFAAPMGGMFPAPHGAVCAALLPHVMTINLQALAQRAPQSPILLRYAEVARLLTGQPQATAEDGVNWVASLCRELQIPLLSRYGMSRADLPVLIEKAAQASSMKANPIVLTPEELAEIVRRAL